MDKAESRIIKLFDECHLEHIGFRELQTRVIEVCKQHDDGQYAHCHNVISNLQHEIQDLKKTNEQYVELKDGGLHTISSLKAQLADMFRKKDGYIHTVRANADKINDLEQRLQEKEHKLDTAMRVIKNECENDTAVREEAKKVLTEFEVEGDSYGVPMLQDITELLVKKIQDLERQLREAEEIIAYSVHHYGSLSYSTDRAKQFLNRKENPRPESKPDGVQENYRVDKAKAESSRRNIPEPSGDSRPECSRCNDNGCPACDGTKGSKYNPEPY